jgi:ABC-type glycerol-3-phosphate transport system substrate-binding protein
VRLGSKGTRPTLLNLGSFVNDPAFPRSDFYPGTLDDLSWQGSVYGLPASVNLFVIYYDKQAFDAAGVPYPRIGWTWGRSGAKVCPTGQCRIVHLADTLQPRVWYNAEAQSAVLMYNG